MATHWGEVGRRPLIPAGRRPLVWVLMAVAAAGFVALAIPVSHTSDPTAFDSAVGNWLYTHTGSFVRDLLLATCEPALTVGVVAVITVGALLMRRWDVAAFAGGAQLVAVVLGSEILKPIVHRRFGLGEQLSRGLLPAGWAFPSGHETALTSAVLVLLVLVLRADLSGRRRAVAVSLAVLWILLGAAGLVRNLYHYATDTVGGICIATVVVFGTALVVDAVTGRLDVKRANDRADEPQFT